MIRQRFIERIAEIPAVRAMQAHRIQQLALRAQPFEEEDQLELEADDGVDARATALSVLVTDLVTHARRRGRASRPSGDRSW